MHKSNKNGRVKNYTPTIYLAFSNPYLICSHSLLTTPTHTHTHTSFFWNILKNHNHHAILLF